MSSLNLEAISAHFVAAHYENLTISRFGLIRGVEVGVQNILYICRQITNCLSFIILVKDFFLLIICFKKYRLPLE